MGISIPQEATGVSSREKGVGQITVHRHPGIKFLGLILVLAGGLALLRLTPVSAYLDPQRLRELIEGLGPAPALIYFVAYAAGPPLLFPASIISLAGGLLFGPVLGTFLTVIAATIGATISFVIARSLGREFVAGLLRGRVERMDTALEEHGLKVLLFLRLVPLVPFNSLNYLAGLSRISLRDYLLGTFFGIIPGTFAYVYLGSTLLKPFSAEFFLAISLFLLLILVPNWIRHRRKLARSEDS